MKFSASLALLVFSFATNAWGQNLSSSEKAIAEAARSKYYSLPSSGFHSLSCSVKFDLDTVPLISSAQNDAVRKLISTTNFTFSIDDQGKIVVQYLYPSGTTEAASSAALPTTKLLTSLVQGMFQTWPTKGLQGPIPPFDSQIESVTKTEQGYIFALHVPGEPVQVFTNKDYVATKILSLDGKIEEHPSYAAGPNGLVFTGNSTIDNTNPNGKVEVSYELGTTVISGLTVPSSVRLRVKPNIDTRFALNSCTVSKLTVVHFK